MSALSMTAPQFTLEQLAEEHASLSEEEKNWVHNDVYGTNYPTDDAFEVTVNETTEFLAELTELTKEQMDALPEMKKAAYLEAVEKCPDEIEYVANPIRFLRCMNYLPKVSVFVCMELCVYGVVSAKRTHLFCARLSLPTHPLTDQRTNGFFLPCSIHPSPIFFLPCHRMLHHAWRVTGRCESTSSRTVPSAI